jgi:hypothetical protein
MKLKRRSDRRLDSRTRLGLLIYSKRGTVCPLCLRNAFPLESATFFRVPIPEEAQLTADFSAHAVECINFSYEGTLSDPCECRQRSGRDFLSREREKRH